MTKKNTINFNIASGTEEDHALIKAILDKDTTKIHRALKNGANPNTKAFIPDEIEEGAVPALIACVLKANRAGVELLINAGADINAIACDSRPERALNIAASICDTSMAAMLIRLGANVDLPDHNGETPRQAFESWKLLSGSLAISLVNAETNNLEIAAEKMAAIDEVLNLINSKSSKYEPKNKFHEMIGRIVRETAGREDLDPPNLH